MLEQINYVSEIKNIADQLMDWKRAPVEKKMNWSGYNILFCFWCYSHPQN